VVDIVLAAATYFEIFGSDTDILLLLMPFDR